MALDNGTIAFNYNALRGLIVSRYGKYQTFADSIGWTVVKLSRKLNGFGMTYDDVYFLANVLEIPAEMIGHYFFCVDSSES